MKQQGISVVFLNAGTNLNYFTGTEWCASDRLVGALLPAKGEIEYIVPHFEVDTLRAFARIQAPMITWHEDENPQKLVIDRLAQLKVKSGDFAIDESLAFFGFDGFRQCSSQFNFVNAKSITAQCRMIKSSSELFLMQQAVNMTFEVIKATAKFLHQGISAQQVAEFIDLAHQRVGAKGSSFCIVLFGVDSSFPHGVKSPKSLELGEIVLIDTGCLVEGYNSDITRTFVFGESNQRQQEIWAIEKQAQVMAFERAQLGVPCGDVDLAARDYIASQGLGPNYEVPGLPHRTGHGTGLDIHEWPYLVKNDRTPLATGMCASIEPMLVIPEEFGVRLEDHFFMTDEGPQWFSLPSHSIEDPFGYESQSGVTITEGR